MQFPRLRVFPRRWPGFALFGGASDDRSIGGSIRRSPRSRSTRDARLKELADAARRVRASVGNAMPELVVHQAGHIVMSVPLRDGLRLGRGDDNDVVLGDPKISRSHLLFRAIERGFSIEDAGSTHGTLLNGARISTAELSDGDVVQIGGVLLTYLALEPSGEILHERATALEPPVAPSGDSGNQLRLLYEVSRAVGSLEDEEALLRRLLEATVEVLGCERGLVGLPEGEGFRRIAHTRRGPPGQPVVSREIIQAVMERRRGVIVRGTPDKNLTMERERIQSAMAAPLVASGRLLGFVYVDDRGDVDRFREADLEFLGALTTLTAAALDGAERYRHAAAVAETQGGGEVNDLLGASPPMQRLRAQVQKCASASRAHVFVRGESGTGKELVARTLHALSPRAEQPFVALNCAAMPESMIESELFGHEKGAFTGAARAKRGRFALAHRGTLFLDEIGDLSLAAQAKVLRAIQEGEVQPLGSETTVHVDVRVLSATHKDLLAESAAHRFREDLFYRLNVVELEVPPLRERGEDIELLARRFLATAAARAGKRFDGFTAAALERLAAHRWPGNVRELMNEVERAVILSDGPLVGAEDLSGRILAAGGAPPTGGASPAARGGDASLAERFAALETDERRFVAEALTRARGNLAEGARLLGITRIMMKRRVDRFGLSASDDDE